MRQPAVGLYGATSTHPMLSKKGFPEHHAAIKKFMTLPIYDQDNIVAVIGLANKKTDYDEMDLAGQS